MRIAFRPNLRAYRGKLLDGARATKGTEVHAGAFLKKREITLDAALLDDAPELMRILTHELFHFAWRRLDNASRREWEQLLAAEQTTGELGWSAEYRRQELTPADIRRRTKRWREYCCESFSDTAAWLYSPGAPHDEYTLPARYRKQRRAWFLHLMKRRKLAL